MFWNYLTIIYICWETITDMKTHIIALLLLIGGVLNLLEKTYITFSTDIISASLQKILGYPIISSMIFTKTLKDIFG